MKKEKLRGAIDAAVEGFKGAFKPGAYTAGGEKVICPHCKRDQFDKQEVMLAGGTGLICTNCGLMQWFWKLTVKMPIEKKSD